MISGTSFTLVGVVNKFLTVLLNVIAWDKHSTPFGIFSVCICLGAGFFYQQAPRRDVKHKEEIKLNDINHVKSNVDKQERSPLLANEDGDRK